MELAKLLPNYCITRFNAEFYTDSKRYYELFAEAKKLLESHEGINSYPEMCGYLDQCFLNVIK